jgi:hypothetical protein
MWSKTYGESDYDSAQCVIQTYDGGFVLAGNWLIKIDEVGNLEWNRSYDGADRFASVIEESDGGLILAGDTRSYGAESADFWLVKTDELGNVEWNKTYGGADFDRAHAFVKTSDGGYALAGETYSNGAGENDVWLVKTDESGNMVWSQTYGGVGIDNAFSLVETSDGGFAIAGRTRTSGEEHTDAMLIKTDGSGEEEWTRTFGQTGENRVFRSLVETSHGGFVLAGSIYTFDISDRDIWLVKTDGVGNLEWNHTYGGPRFDDAYSLVQTSDGGYALTGETRSHGYGNDDVWLIKTDPNGNSEWNRTYGGELDDHAYSLIELSDGGFAIAGETESFGAGGDDVWFIRTNEQGVPEFASWTPLMVMIVALVAVTVIYRRRLFKNQGKVD